MNQTLHFLISSQKKILQMSLYFEGVEFDQVLDSFQPAVAILGCVETEWETYLLLIFSITKSTYKISFLFNAYSLAFETWGVFRDTLYILTISEQLFHLT